MAIAGFVIALAALAISLGTTVGLIIQIQRIQRAYLAQVAMVLGRMNEIEESVSRIGEGGYLMLRMLMEKGVIDEEEMETAWRTYVEEPRERAREFAELVKEWKEKPEQDGVLVEDPPKTTH
jgi:hypothetical protein